MSKTKLICSVLFLIAGRWGNVLGDEDSYCQTIESTVSCKGDVDSSEIDEFVDILELTKTDMQSMDQGFLNRFEFLKALHLKGCKTLPPQGFLSPGTKRLLTLNINDCQVSHDDVADFLKGAPTSLHSMSLARNNLQIVKKRTLSAVPHLQFLNLSSNSISKLQHGALSNLSSLYTLDLSSNKIYNIDPEAFKGVTYLQKLILKDNEITVISQRALDNLQNLRTLDLSFNAISYIVENVFKEMQSLEKLDLSSNWLKEVKPGFLTGLTAVHELLLSKNNISRISKDALWGMSSLWLLDLSHNAIEHLFQATLDLPALRVLNLAHNRIGKGFRPSFVWKASSGGVCLFCGWACTSDHAAHDVAACKPGRTINAIWTWWAKGLPSMDTRSLQLEGNPVCREADLHETLLREEHRCAQVSECFPAELRRLLLVETCTPAPTFTPPLSELSKLSHSAIATAICVLFPLAFAFWFILRH